MAQLHPTPSTTKSALREGAAALGLPLDAAKMGALSRYQALLAEWNAKINLTALRDPGAVVVGHFLDSLALVRALPTADLAPPTLVDVGSGAGFPGVLCALLRPDLRVTLVERIGKKAAFLLALRRELGLTYQVEASDAERLVSSAGDGGFGIVVSRAALPLPGWLALGARLGSPAGWVFAMTTPHEPLPPPSSLLAVGLAPRPVHDSDYDVGAGRRRLLAFRKG
jgi:16S rRNA (guanine527-N7)-methyltransferase